VALDVALSMIGFDQQNSRVVMKKGKVVWRPGLAFGGAFPSAKALARQWNSSQSEALHCQFGSEGDSRDVLVLVTFGRTITLSIAQPYLIRGSLLLSITSKQTITGPCMHIDNSQGPKQMQAAPKCFRAKSISSGVRIRIGRDNVRFNCC
jgi:hypothetical protein